MGKKMMEGNVKGQAGLNRNGNACDKNGQGWEGPGRAGRGQARGHSGMGRAGEGQALTSVGSVAALAQKRLLRAMPVWSALPTAGGEEVSVAGARGGPGGHMQTHLGGCRVGCWAPASALASGACGVRGGQGCPRRSLC